MLEAVGMRRAMVLGLFAVLVLALAAPAWARTPKAQRRLWSCRAGPTSPRGQRVGDLVVVHGSATVDGTVDGSLTAR
jgi:hypothetical protein